MELSQEVLSLATEIKLRKTEKRDFACTIKELYCFSKKRFYNEEDLPVFSSKARSIYQRIITVLYANKLKGLLANYIHFIIK